MTHAHEIPNVFIVEDPDFNRKEMTVAMSATRIDATAAEDGQAGLAQMRNGHLI